jgi:hypothetical protein
LTLQYRAFHPLPPQLHITQGVDPQLTFKASAKNYELLSLVIDALFQTTAAVLTSSLLFRDVTQRQFVVTYRLSGQPIGPEISVTSQKTEELMNDVLNP